MGFRIAQQFSTRASLPAKTTQFLSNRSEEIELVVLVRVSASFASLSWGLLSSPGRGSSSRTVGLQASRFCCGDGGVAFPFAAALGFRR